MAHLHIFICVVQLIFSSRRSSRQEQKLCARFVRLERISAVVVFGIEKSPAQA